MKSMLYHITPVTVILFATAIVLLMLSSYLCLQRKKKGASIFSVLMFASSVWAFAVGCESMSLTVSQRVFWSKISYFGIVCVGPLWFLFSFRYAQIKNVIIKKYRLIIWIIPILSLILVLTNDYHNLIWTNTVPVSDDILQGVDYNHGILFYVHMGYEYILLLIGLFVLIKYLLKSSKLEKKQIAFVIGGLFVTWIANFLYIILGTEKVIGGVELTPLALLLTGMFIALSVLKYKFFSFIPEAKDRIFKTLNTALIIVNKKGTIMDFNYQASDLIGKHLKQGADITKFDPIGEIDLAEIFRSGEDLDQYFIEKRNIWVDVDINDFKNDKDEIVGKIIVIYNISSVIRAQKDVRKSNRLLKSIIDFLPDATFVLDKNGTVLIWNKAMEKMTNIKASDMVGKGDYEYAVPLYNEKRPLLADMIREGKSREEIEKRYEGIKVEGETYSKRLNVKTEKGEEKIMWIVAKPLYNDKGKLIGAIESIRDITESGKIKEELDKKVKELTKLNKLMIGRELRLADIKKKLKKKGIDLSDLQEKSLE